MNRKNIQITIISCFLLLLVIGGAFLYNMRYRGSDIYPYYSSFRSDQMGTKLLYKSLDNIPELEIKRNFRPLYEIKNPKQSTVLLFGCHFSTFFYRKNYDELNKYLLTGGRAVVSYAKLPENYLFTPPKEDKKSKEKKDKKSSKKNKKALKPKSCINAKDLDIPDKSWIKENFGAWLTRFNREMRFPQSVSPTKGLKLPPIMIYSKSHFYLENPKWKVLFSKLGKPVVIERKYPGGGSLVFCADSYMFSNEALASKANSKMLLYMLGNKKNIIFDETHLGAVKTRNIAWLARKYNLVPFFIVLAATLILYIWRSLLVPYNSHKEEQEESLPENFSNSSLVNMLKANFPTKQLLNECWKEFEAGKTRKFMSDKKLKKLKDIVSENEKSVILYNKAVEEYNKREGIQDD